MCLCITKPCKTNSCRDCKICSWFCMYQNKNIVIKKSFGKNDLWKLLMSCPGLSYSQTCWYECSVSWYGIFFKYTVQAISSIHILLSISWNTFKNPSLIWLHIRLRMRVQPNDRNGSLMASSLLREKLCGSLFVKKSRSYYRHVDTECIVCCGMFWKFQQKYPYFKSWHFIRIYIIKAALKKKSMKSQKEKYGHSMNVTAQ